MKKDLSVRVEQAKGSWNSGNLHEFKIVPHENSIFPPSNILEKIARDAI
jgi:hypothetical protein